MRTWVGKFKKGVNTAEGFLGVEVFESLYVVVQKGWFECWLGGGG